MSTDTPQSTPSSPPLLPGQTVMRIREDRRLTASWLLAFFLPVLVGVGFWIGWPLYQKQRALNQALAYTGIKLEDGVRAGVERVRIEDVGALPESLRRAAEGDRPWRVTLANVKLRWQVGENEYENPEPLTLLVFLDASARLLKITSREPDFVSAEYLSERISEFVRVEAIAAAPPKVNFAEVLSLVRAKKAAPAKGILAFCFSAAPGHNYGSFPSPRPAWFVYLDAAEPLDPPLKIFDAETGELFFSFQPTPWPTRPAPLP